jgi:hypothetical protein
MLWRVSDGDSLRTKTAYYSFDFMEALPQSREFWGRVPASHRILVYLVNRIGNYDMLFDYGWHLSSRQVSFLGSYVGEEGLHMDASQKGIPREYYFRLVAYDSSSNNCYNDRIYISLSRVRYSADTELSYNVYKGYWDEILKSECMAS